MIFALLFLALFSDSARVPVSAGLRLVDDTGEEIRAPIRVCLNAGLLTECLEQAPYTVPSKLAGFTGVTAEGPGHGPVAIDRLALEQDGTGIYRLRVPRKASVAVRTAKDPQTAVSLYPVDDPSFRRPSFRFSAVGSQGLLVPAGEFLVAIGDGTYAPKVFAATLKPGSRNIFTFSRLPGWSAVLRCQSSTALVPGCSVRSLSASRPSGQREIAKGIGDRWGLVTFSALTEPFVTMAISAPGFVSEEARGITARNGTFAFHAATLSRGGAARARVTLDDRPVPRTRCRLLDLRGNDVGAPTEETLYDGATTKEGICETTRVAAGDYVLRVGPVANAQPADEPVSLIENKNSEVEIRLRSIAVAGRVYRGNALQPGAVVRVVRAEDRERHSSLYLEVNTDDDGKYRGVVWSPGEYSFVVMNAARSAVGTVRRVQVDEDGAEVDLHLNAYEVTGRVEDDEKKPIADATVLLTRNERSHRATKSLLDGTFAFPIDGDGAVRVTSEKTGYEPGQAAEFVLNLDVEPPPIMLTMKKLPSVRGVVFWPSGVRAPNIGVGSFQIVTGRPPMALGAQRTDPAGAFEVPRSPAGLTELFATGPGCPLLVSSAPESSEVTLRCPAESAGMQLLLRDPSGAPRSHESVILRWQGTLIPRGVLRDHLLMLGLPTETDGAGRLILVGLPAGTYDVFLGRGASEATIAAGMPHGYLTSVLLTPFDRPEIEITAQ
jgi:hypothetical protein